VHIGKKYQHFVEARWHPLQSCLGNILLVPLWRRSSHLFRNFGT